MGNRRYDAEVPSQPEEALHFLYISTSKYEGDWQSIRHTHPFSELFYVVGGKGSFEVSDTHFMIEPDDLIIVNPQITHTERSYHQEPLEYIVLGIQGLSFSEDYAHYSYHGKNKEIFFLIRQILEETLKKQEHYSDVCEKLLEVLLIHIMRRQHLTINNAIDIQLSKECLQIQHYLDSNYADPITLDTLAKTAHMNKYYLAHVFTRYTGISPIRYLIQKRVSEAKTLLLTTDYSISQIALSVGFSSQSYFAQVFRRETGMSPVAYRKQTSL
ncbi:MAG: AraC family transcriptional regulator [Lachnospiraceae bacterium]|nr:AraC family transcriptional regulator [Lachnospiraceae bacterium]